VPRYTAAVRALFALGSLLQLADVLLLRSPMVINVGYFLFRAMLALFLPMI